MKTARELIGEIYVNKANLEHIAKTGKINGTLLLAIEDKMYEYANQQKGIKQTCARCNGRGEYGNAFESHTCPSCKGTGEV